MPLLFALLSGGLSAFAFRPFAFAPLMIIGFAVLCELVWRARRMRGALLIGWTFALGQFCVGLNWIATAFTFQANMPAWLGWIAVLLLSVYLAWFMMLATALAWRLGKGQPGREQKLAFVLVLAGGWILAEWLRGGMFTGFAWNPVGVMLVDTPLRRASGLVGTYGLSGVTVLLGGALWLAIRRHLRKAVAVLLPIAAVALAALALPHAPADTSKRVRIVQPDIGQENRWSQGAAEAGIARHLQLSGPPSAAPRLLLWPESAVTLPLEDDRPGTASGIDAQRRAVTAVLGPTDLLVAGSEGLASTDGLRVTSARNSAFVLGPGGRYLGRYDKAHLVPYGEYLPMRPLLSAIGLSRLAPGDLDFDSGPGPRSIDLPGFGRMGLQICYEIIFSGEVVDRARRPDFLFNPSNDSWFGSWGPPQHLAQARLRAAEEGIPVLRATPTGVSALVDAEGNVRQSLAPHVAGVIDGALPAARPQTPFALIGNEIPLTIGFLLIFVAMLMPRRR